MDDSASGFDPGSGRGGRRHTINSSMAASFTLPASTQNPFSCSAEPFSRQRSLSSIIPIITVDYEDDALGIWSMDQNTDSQSLTNRRARIADSFDSIAVPPQSPQLSDTGSGVGLGLRDPFATSAQQPQPSPNGSSSLIQTNANIIQWNQQLQPNLLTVIPYSEYGMSSPVLSPVPSPNLPSSTFDSPIASPFASNSLLSSPVFPQYTDYTAAATGANNSNNAQSYVNSPVIGNTSSPKPHLTVNTQELYPPGSFGSSDGCSGSTPGWDSLNRSPLEYTSSSQATSPAPSNASSGYPELPLASPYPSEAVIDDSQFPSFASQQQQLRQHGQDSSEETTPTSLSQLPPFTPLLQVPRESRHHRRESDPFPKSNGHVQDESSRINRSKSQKRRSPSHSRERFVQDFLHNNSDSVPDRLLRAPSPGPRSPTPGSTKGKRIGPMSDQGRSNATERRVNKDTCVSCKVARVKCDPSQDIWGTCTKCQSGSSMKSNGAHLCGYHSFSHKVTSLTLDYTTNYWITPSRPCSPTPSRLFVPMPQSLSLSTLQDNFSCLIRSSFPTIRVSSNNLVLYDISLAGSILYLSNERNSSLSSHRSWPALINTLSAVFEDGWLDCLTPSYRRKASEDILSILPSWTTQQGCFTYSLVSSVNATVQQLDPDVPTQKSLIISAAQVSRIIARKVERIGLAELQAVLPNSSKESKPSPNNLPDPNHVRTLGLLALSLRFQHYTWSLSNTPRPLPIPESTHSDCVEAIRCVCRSLYVNHCWLHRILLPLLPLSTGPPIDCNISLYAGAGQAVSELMSRGESDDGFMEWWREGALKVLEARMDPVVVSGGNGNVDVLMSGTGLYA